jgi:membrane protease YdiL (CAAX protease family)
LGFALVVVWYFFLSKKPVKALVGKPSAWDFVLAIAMQFGLMFFLGGLNEWFVILLKNWGLSAPEPQIPSLDGFGFVGVLLVVAVLPAILEEAVFRGVLLDGLRQFPVWAAALLCGGMFSLFHQNPAQTIYQFFCGVAFALIALRSRSILPTVVAHFLNNAFILCVTKFGWQVDMLPILIASAVCFVGASAYLVYWAIKQEKIRRKEAKPTDKKGRWQFLLFALAGLLICTIGWVSQLLGA